MDEKRVEELSARRRTASPWLSRWGWQIPFTVGKRLNLFMIVPPGRAAHWIAVGCAYEVDEMGHPVK